MQTPPLLADPLPPVNRLTGVKTLPCPKPHLQAVITKILGSKSFTRWLISLALALALALALVLALVLELVLVLELELVLVLVLELALALALELELVLDIEGYHITTSVSHLTCPPCHHITQSFDLPTATKSVSHLTCPLPPCHYNTTLLYRSVI